MDEARTVRAYQATGHSNRLLVARSAENALMLLRACANGLRFKLVLLDLHLTGMGAKAFLAKLRKDERIRDVPVVMMANHHESDEEVHEQSIQAETWVRRPSEHGKLSLLLDRLVRFFVMRPTKAEQRKVEAR